MGRFSTSREIPSWVPKGRRTHRPEAAIAARARSHLVLALALCWAVAAPAAADTSTEAGVFTALAAGTHVSNATQPVTGVVPAAAIEFRQHVDNVWLHLEGVPTVTATGTNASGPFGSSSATLSILNSTIMVDLDPHRRFHVGAGMQVVNLSNVDGTTGQRNFSRETTPIYAAGATLPLPNRHVVELNVMVDPNVRANLLVVDATGAPLPTRPEQGAEVDYSAAYGWRRGIIEYLVGLRGLSYHTRDTNTGALVDRNVGGGATFEVRFHFGPKDEP